MMAEEVRTFRSRRLRMPVGPVAGQSAAGVRECLGIDFPSRDAPAGQPLIASHPSVQSTRDVLRHAGRTGVFGGDPEPRADTRIQTHGDPFLLATHPLRLQRAYAAEKRVAVARDDLTTGIGRRYMA